MRFKDPSKFLEFYEKQLSRNVVGLRHPQPILAGTELIVIVSPPGAPDQLCYEGSVSQVKRRPDGSVRLRVDVRSDPDAEGWLNAYLTGLKAAMAWAESDDSLTIKREPVASAQEILELAARLQTMTYYQVLGVERSVTEPELQKRFHTVTRRFHPDLFHDDPNRAVLMAVNRVYRRMNEAYAVIKSPHRRKSYDTGLKGPAHEWSLRLSEGAHEAARRRERVRRGMTRTGDWYWRTARQVLEHARENEVSIRPALREAASMLRVALAFEPDNEHFRHALEHVVTQLAAPEV